MKISNLNELFLHELGDLYSAETQIITALPEMISSATDEKLSQALEDHLQVTREQLSRLDEVAEGLDFQLSTNHCQGIAGIIAEAKETLSKISDSATKDVAIIVLAQRVEHYEIAAYGGAVEFARELDYPEAEELLEKTLKEEGQADKKLSSLAKGGIFSAGLNDTAIETS